METVWNFLQGSGLLALGGLVPVALALGFVALKCIYYIGETEVGLVTKRFSFKKRKDDNPIAFNGESGYQADLMMPGVGFRLWPLYVVQKHPWVQVPTDEIGVVYAQVGQPLPVGAISARYKESFGDFTNVRQFVAEGGEKGVQRPVLRPGSTGPIHPVGFIVLTKRGVYGIAVSDEFKGKHQLALQDFGREPDDFNLVRIEAEKDDKGNVYDNCGVVETFDGQMLTTGAPASRLGDFEDITDALTEAERIERCLSNRNEEHKSYQNFQAFIDLGGRRGIQHDPIMPGAYALNPFLVRVEQVRMLLVNQGEVAVVKASVGHAPRDISGTEFRHGSIVKPGDRGVWNEPLRTGKYALNPHCYRYEIVPTAILTLNWAEATSAAHSFDKGLKSISAKSKEGFPFSIDLQVQIHVGEAMASRVISMVGTMHNLVNEVLQAAVGNHFRDTLQAMEATKFIEQRRSIQEAATTYIKDQLQRYNVETLGVYIQDVILPTDLVRVLQEREIAAQRVATYSKEKEAEDERLAKEAAKGRADQQADLAKSEIGITIAENHAKARIAAANGDAQYVQKTGEVAGAEVRAIGLARAEGFKAQAEALGGPQAVAIINAVNALADKHIQLVPQVLVVGGNSGPIDGLAAVLTQLIQSGELKIPGTAHESPETTTSNETGGDQVAATGSERIESLVPEA